MLNQKLTGQQAAEKTYIEDVFSTYLYTGNGSAQDINNGIALGDALTITPGTSLGGGYFAGVIKQGGTDYAVIVAPKATGDSSGKQWKTTNTAGPTETQTLNNGSAASSSMNSAEYPAAQFCEGLSIGGYTDWYLPSRDELEICYRNLNPNTTANNVSARPKSAYTYPEGNDVSGDTMGINRNSSPTGAAYTTGNPTQTSVTAFKTGGTEAFAADSYWSSSEYSAPYAWAQNFGNGYQYYDTKNNSNYVRAARRIPVSDPSLDPYRVTGKGGMVWLKGRSGATDNALYDTVRGATKDLISNSTAAEIIQSTGLTAFNSNGFSIGALAKLNTSAATYASWTFRKAPKFFDVVTYTGNGVAGRQISHSLGQAPGMIIVKRTDSTASWAVYHRSLNDYYNLILNTTAAQAMNGCFGTVANQTASNFEIGFDNLFQTNQSGATYVAYLFAHDTTTDGLIQCGSFTHTAGVNTQINLGWEPQFVLYKLSDASGYNWQIADTMRGMTLTEVQLLNANSSSSEVTQSRTNAIQPTSTGFSFGGWYGSGNYIYMAIRRGPMRTPTDATKVFMPITLNNATATVNTTGFPVDLQIQKYRGGTGDNFFIDRLRGFSTNGAGSGVRLISNSTAAEGSASNLALYFDNTGFQTASGWDALSVCYQNFRRAPGFFDVVCYTGTGVARTVNHNLGVAPELVIVKQRSGTQWWNVIAPNIGGAKWMYLNSSSYGWQGPNSTLWPSTPATSTVLNLATDDATNSSSSTYVAYLFASCPGVSKVGSYTGNGSSQTINCGFTNGARFVLIKRTDSTGDWYVWDTARGIVAATDPHLSLNTTAAEVTTDDTIDPTSTGFIVNQVAATNVNVSGASYIYLAIA